MRTTPLVLLVALLTACSSDPPEDTPDDDGAGSSESGEPGGTGEDEGGSSGEESTGEPVSEWPPECVAAGECAGLELAILDAGCVVEGLDVLSIDAAWTRKVPDVQPVSVAAECGEPMRVTVADAGIFDLRIAVTYGYEDVSWLCVYDEGGGGSEGPDALGDVHTWERSIFTMGIFPAPAGIDSPPEPGVQGAGCCLLSGQPADEYVQTPCEGA